MAASERVTPEWLVSVGIYPSDEGKKHPDDPPKEFGVRIVGGTDDGWKSSSDQDEDGDEIAVLVVAFEGDRGSVSVYIETYSLPALKTTGLIELGSRTSRDEILDLCRSLKAWAVRYKAAEAKP